MIAFFLTVFLDLVTGSTSKMLDAVGSFENPPRNLAAKQTRQVAMVFLLIGTCCGLTAGIVFDVNKPSLVDDVFGWAGLLCLFACVICGFRYQFVNATASGYSE